MRQPPGGRRPRGNTAALDPLLDSQERWRHCCPARAELEQQLDTSAEIVRERAR
jgi:hypothetical protein